jgi:hypothetical protein
MLCQYCERFESRPACAPYCSDLCRKLEARENARFGRYLPWNHRIWRTDYRDPLESSWPVFAEYISQYLEAFHSLRSTSFPDSRAQSDRSA